MSGVYLGSFVASQKLPVHHQPWIAFLGRSNVGKSSLINLLAGSAIAKISGTPGKTQTLNLFQVNEKWIFGDFPGYGFARVPKDVRKQFDLLVKEFLTPENFRHAVQIVDSRHPALDMDLQLHEWLVSVRLSHTVVMNKSDQLNQKEKAKAEKAAVEYYPQQEIIFASTYTKQGKRELIKLLDKITFS